MFVSKIYRIKEIRKTGYSDFYIQECVRFLMIEMDWCTIEVVYTYEEACEYLSKFKKLKRVVIHEF